MPLPQGPMDTVAVNPSGSGYTRHRAGALCVLWRFGPDREWVLSITHVPSGRAAVQASADGRRVPATLANERRMVRLMRRLAALGEWPADPSAIPAAWGAAVRAAVADLLPGQPGWCVRRGVDGAAWVSSASAAARAWQGDPDVWAVEEWTVRPHAKATRQGLERYAAGCSAAEYGGGKLRRVQWRGRGWESTAEGDQVTTTGPTPTHLDTLRAVLALAYQPAADTRPTGDYVAAADAAAFAGGLVVAVHVDDDGRPCDPAKAIRSRPAILPTQRGLLALARAARAGEGVVCAHRSIASAAEQYRAHRRHNRPPWPPAAPRTPSAASMPFWSYWPPWRWRRPRSSSPLAWRARPRGSWPTSGARSPLPT